MFEQFEKETNEVLFKGKSEFNGTVMCYEHRGFRYIGTVYKSRFPTTQTGVKISNPYISKFPMYPAGLTISLAFHRPNPRITLVGVAGGFLLNYLNRFAPDAPLTALEIDPVMVELAQKHFGVKHPIQIRDGHEYVMAYPEGKKDQDIFILDAFNGMHIPDVFNKDEFFDTLKKNVLTENGTFAANIVLNKDTDEIIKRIKSHFLYVREYESKGNLMLMATDAFIPEHELEENAAAHQEVQGYLYSLPEMMRRYKKRKEKLPAGFLS